MEQFEALTDSVFYIMSSLSEPRHGYAIMKLIEDTTDGTFIIGPASLYTIIKKLMKENYIELHDISDGRRKVMIDFAQQGLSGGVKGEEE